MFLKSKVDVDSATFTVPIINLSKIMVSPLYKTDVDGCNALFISHFLYWVKDSTKNKTWRR